MAVVFVYINWNLFSNENWNTSQQGEELNERAAAQNKCCQFLPFLNLKKKKKKKNDIQEEWRDEELLFL